MELISGESPEASQRLLRQINRAIEDASACLRDFDPNQLIEFMYTIDVELECLEEWDDENGISEFGFSKIELIRQLGVRFGAGLYLKKLGEVNDQVLLATFALFRAQEGRRLLTKLRDYRKAAVACSDAFEALYLGASAFDRIDEEISAIMRSNRAKKGKEATVENKNDDRITVMEELESLISEDADTKELMHKEEDELSTTLESKTYKLKMKNGKWNISRIARYIHDKLILLRQQDKKDPLIDISLQTIQETVSLYLNKRDKLHEILNYKLIENYDGILENCEDEHWSYPIADNNKSKKC